MHRSYLNDETVAKRAQEKKEIIEENTIEKFDHVTSSSKRVTAATSLYT